MIKAINYLDVINKLKLFMRFLKKKNIDFQIYVRELSLLYSFKIHVPILIYKYLMITSLKLPDSDWLHGEISIDRNIKKGG